MELPKDFPFHLMFPTPYPEPPRVISSKPLVSDVSITSEMPSVELPRGGVGVLKNPVNPKVKFKPLRTNLPSSRQPLPNPTRTINNHNRILTSKQQPQQSKPQHQPKVSPHQPTTSIYPSEETLQEIRRKYGLIPTKDGANDGGYSSDEESVVEEEPKKNPSKKNTVTSRTASKASTTTTSKPTESKPNESDQNLIRVRMQQIQSDLKKQFEKLQLREEVAAATESVPKTISKPVSPQPSSNHNPRTSRKESTTSSSSKESSDPETSSSTTTTTSGISSSDISSVSKESKESSSSSLPCKCNNKQDTSQRSSSSTGISSLPSSNCSLKNVNEQQQMMDYIKSQDRQLKQISAQIDELLRIHHQNPSLEEEDDRHQTKPKRIFSKGPPKRTIETMTSFVQHHHHEHDTTDYKKLPNFPSKGARATGDQKNQQPKTTKSRPKVIKVPSCSDYLDSSIEKARLDLQRSLQSSSSSSSSDEEVAEATRPREKPRSSRPATESNQDMYSNMIHTINSILVRNGSFESQDNTETIYRGDHDHESSGDHSNGHRSSCSNTPDNTASDREELLGAFRAHHHCVYHQQHQTSSPKRVQRTMLTSKTSLTARTKSTKSSPNTRVKKRLLHSEQSLYIQRLASKYEIEEEEDDDGSDDGSSDDGQQEDLFREYLLRGQRPKVNNDTQDILKRFDLDREYDLKVYCLSDHNTSIATRNYLEKYGLTHSPPSHKNHPPPQNKNLHLPKKNPIQNHQLGGGRRIGTLNRKLNHPREHETLMEEDEDEEDEEVRSLKVNSNKPRSGKEAPVSMKKSKVREVKSRPHSERINDDLPDSRYNKILDLDAIKSLPKLT